MNTLVLNNRRDWSSIANTALKTSAQLWFIVATIGMWLFVYYILGFYAGPTLQGDFEAWSRNKMVPHGFVRGDTIGNLQFAAHVLLAAVMTFGGTLQLVPQLRARFPKVHRWTGRVFIVLAILLSVGGLYLVWIGGRRNLLISSLTISLNAVLIIGCAVMAWRCALARDFTAHRRWALRTFLLANGVLFLRLGYMAWIIINQGPVGIAKGGGGWFDISWKLGSFLLPLLILEIYLRVKQSGGTSAKFATSVLLVASSVVTAIGAFGAFNVFWRPLL